MTDRLTSKTPMCVDEFNKIGVKGDIAEFPDSDMQPMVFADLGDRMRRQVKSSPLRCYAAMSRPPSVGSIRDPAMLPSPLALWIDNYRVCGVRRPGKPPIWERTEHGCSAG